MENPFSSLRRAFQRSSSSDSWDTVINRQLGYGVDEEPNWSSTPAYKQKIIHRVTARPQYDFSDIPEEDCIYVGGVKVPIKKMRNVKITGSPGAGKTLQVNAILKSAIESGRKVIVYDTKGETRKNLEWYKYHKPGFRYQSINISDLNAGSWDMFADYDTLAKMSTLAKKFVPDVRGGGGGGQFYRDATRLIYDRCGGYLLYNSDAPNLVHYYSCLTSGPDELEEIVASAPGGKSTAERVFNTKAGETADNLVMGIEAEVAKLRIAATHCAHNDKETGGMVSVREFLENPDGPQVLLIEQDLTERVAAEPILTGVFKAIVDTINTRSDRNEPDTFLFLDELQYLGHFPELVEAAVFSRSKGLVFIIATQDIAGIEELYGPKVAEAILGTCPFTILCRSDSLRTQQWSAEQVGQIELEEHRWRSTYAERGVSVAADVSRQYKRRALPSDFRLIPNPNPDDGQLFCFLSELFGDEIWKHLSAQEIKRRQPETQNYKPRPFTRDTEEVPYHVPGKPWEDDELREFFNAQQQAQQGLGVDSSRQVIDPDPEKNESDKETSQGAVSSPIVDEINQHESMLQADPDDPALDTLKVEQALWFDFARCFVMDQMRSFAEQYPRLLEVFHSEDDDDDDHQKES